MSESLREEREDTKQNVEKIVKKYIRKHNDNILVLVDAVPGTDNFKESIVEEGSGRRIRTGDEESVQTKPNIQVQDAMEQRYIESRVGRKRRQ